MTNSRAHLALRLMVALALASVTAGDGFAEIRWQRSPEQALASARNAEKPILVFVATDWCHYCEKMKQETWSDPTVDRVLNENVVTLMLDGDRDKAIVRKLGLSGYPATLLYTPDGHFIGKQNGYMAPAKTLSWLNSFRR